MTVVSATATLELLLWLICNICMMFIMCVHTVDITFIQMWVHVTCEVVFFMLMDGLCRHVVRYNKLQALTAGNSHLQ